MTGAELLADRCAAFCAEVAERPWLWIWLAAMLFAITVSVCEFFARRHIAGFLWALAGAVFFVLASSVSQAEASSALLVAGPK